MDEADMRGALTGERADVEARLRSLGAEFDEIVSAAADSNGDDEHDPEGATVAFERSRVASLMADARRHADELDRALARLDDGRLGWCAVCGEPIDPERLAALPSAETCVACAGTVGTGSRVGVAARRWAGVAGSGRRS